jgi:hypothetical protein
MRNDRHGGNLLEFSALKQVETVPFLDRLDPQFDFAASFRIVTGLDELRLAFRAEPLH